MFTFINDQLMVFTFIFWLIAILLVSITCIKFIQLCFICHQFMSNTVYVPVYNGYKLYKDFMQIDPHPVIDV